MSKRVKYTPEINLTRVKQYIRDKNYYLARCARNDAEAAFGWYEANIKKAILSLKQSDFSRSVEHDFQPGIYIDHYEANNLLGEKVYMHFHVEDGQLMILSFKKNTR
jgi:hypothetical protein